MFLTQILATICTGVVSYSTADYLLRSVPNICTPENVEWKCPESSTAYSGSVIWGAIGPVRMFGSSSVYHPLLFAFLLGIILPIPGWLLMKGFPQYEWLGYIHFPVIFSGLTRLPTAPAGEYPSWFAVGFFFNFILYRYAHSWWKRYAYLFSAAMSCGVAISAIVIYFTLQINNIYFPTWWGTGGITGDGCPLASANYSGDLPTYAPY
jgi:OPT family oligopeptide transporter